MKALFWGLLALVAVVWPSRIVGPLDGAPLETMADVILVGVILPLTWIVHPRAFAASLPRVIATTLAAWKIGTWLLLTQQGLCATFALPSGVADHQVLRRSWDFRTPAAAGLPQCSAVLSRSLHSRVEFPAWFLNLPIGRDERLDDGTARNVEPQPSSDVYMHLAGFIVSDHAVTPVDREIVLRGDTWQFEMPIDGRLFSVEFATIAPPTAADRVARYFWFVSPVLVVGLVGCTAWRAVTRLRIPRRLAVVLCGIAAVSVLIGFVGEPYTRFAALLLLPLLAFRLPLRLQTLRGVALLLGVPLLATLLAYNAERVGRFTLYTAGDDWQTFQRFAARIFFDGFWLEGGERTFWQQPLYRWIAGLLHVVFGDSSIGEVIWDGFGLIALGTLAYVLVRRYAAAQWALGAAILTLATTMLGPNWYLIGRGLAEISGAMWLSIAAFALLRARHGHLGAAIVAGVVGTLAIYTRLNHLILVAALIVLLLPPVSAGAWIAPAPLFKRLRTRAAVAYGGIIVAGLLLLATRTWYYTGHFSVLHGTTRQFNSTGLAFDTLGDPVVWSQVLDSVLMVVTVSDPPRLDPRSAMVVIGVAAALLALLRAPIVRDVPLAPTVLCLMAISSAFIARGLAYPGRFSLQLIPFAVSVTVLLAVRIARAAR